MAILGSPIAKEVARQALGGAVSARGGLYRYLDRSTQRTNIYLASWEAFHQAGFRAILTLQDSFLQASQAMVEAALWATPLASERRSEPRRIWLDPTLKLSAGSTQILPGYPQSSPEDETLQTREWADSALRFQPPLGSLFSDADDPEGDPGSE